MKEAAGAARLQVTLGRAAAAPSLSILFPQLLSSLHSEVPS